VVRRAVRLLGVVVADVFAVSPGRFFAAVELKLVFALVLLNYDIKLKDGKAGFPESFHFNGVLIPPNLPMLFRKRQL